MGRIWGRNSKKKDAINGRMSKSGREGVKGRGERKKGKARASE